MDDDCWRKLHPMNILGSLSHIPNFVPSIDYFWYGCAGLGDSTIENFMEYEGNYFGFIFTPPNLSYGEMIISSDQDWIGHGTSKPLMQNILYRLGNTITGGKKSAQNIPVEFALYQNYPNPFNPITKIKYESPKSNFVRLIVFNVLGQEVAELVNEQLKPGTYEVKWDGSNYPSGVYFYKLVTADFTETRKMILLK